MRNTCWSWGSVVVVVAAVAAVPAGSATAATDLGPTTSPAAPTYRFIDLGVLTEVPGAFSRAADINAAGAVVGFSTADDLARRHHAFRAQVGSLEDLGAILADGSSSARGVNDHGEVVGHTQVARTEPSHAFHYRDGEMIDLGTGFGSGSVSSANDITNTGLVVGVRHPTVSSPQDAVIWEDGEIRELGTLGGETTQPFGTNGIATAANDQGQVVGTALPEGGVPLHGFIWQDGVMTDLGTLGGNQEATHAEDINEHGQVVGWSPTADGATHAFRWEGGQMQDLGTLGNAASFALGINNAGQVVGTAQLGFGLPPQRALLWDGGTVHDLNDLVLDLPDDVNLELAHAINDDGLIAASTCIVPCVPVAPHRAYLLIPVEVPPETTITAGPRGNVPATSATFEFTADDPAATFECALDDAPFSACTSPQPYTGLAPGTHTFRVRAVTAAGPDPTPADRSWTIVFVGR